MRQFTTYTETSKITSCQCPLNIQRYKGVLPHEVYILTLKPKADGQVSLVLAIPVFSGFSSPLLHKLMASY